MKPALMTTITNTILACGLAVGLASAQSPRLVPAPAGASHAAPQPATTPAKTSPAAVKSAAVTPAKTAPTHAVNNAATHQKKHWDGRRWVVGGVVVVPGAIVAVPQAAAEESSNSGNEAAAGATAEASENAANLPQSAVDRTSNANGKRDPFVSPVVSHAGGSGCSTGKKCLEIGTINLRGVVHSDDGFIAVVSNGLNKAYFLRENDPVFNGYVVKITGDSIVFQETLQDRLGKTFTREVVKKITTPAV